MATTTSVEQTSPRRSQRVQNRNQQQHTDVNQQLNEFRAFMQQTQQQLQTQTDQINTQQRTLAATEQKLQETTTNLTATRTELTEAKQAQTAANTTIAAQTTELNRQRDQIRIAAADIIDLNEAGSRGDSGAKEYNRAIRAAQSTDYFNDIFDVKEYQRVEEKGDNEEEPSYKQKTLWDKILTDFKPKLNKTVRLPLWCKQFEEECEINEIPWTYRLRKLTTIILDADIKREYIRERKEFFDKFCFNQPIDGFISDETICESLQKIVSRAPIDAN
eukprot:1006855_1